MPRSGSSDHNHIFTNYWGLFLQITGDTEKLADHVGQDVRLTHRQASKLSSRPPRANRFFTAAQRLMFDVSQVKKICTTCHASPTNSK